MQTLEILDNLISFPTVSRDPNRALIAFVQDFLAERGVKAELILAEEGRKANLLATIGPADVPGIMLSGHTDVVPVEGQSWSRDPFSLALRDGKAYGRGTADMKGFLAACLSLIDRAVRRRLTMPIQLSFSHDEEIGCIGVRSLIDRLAAAPQRPRFCLVGEPTELRIATGHKGKLAARATCYGVEGHSALTPSALNAIHLACDFVGRLRERQADLVRNGPRDPSYDVPYTTIHAGLIDGGTALNIVPGRCTVDFEIRNVAADDPNALLAGIIEDAAAISAAEVGRFPQARIEVNVVNAYPGLATAETAEVVAFSRKLVEDPATLKIAFGSEGGLFSDRLGVPTVVCGPGSMAQGHKPDEYVSLDQLAACDRMMDRLLEQIVA
jgi:acetylornithine deacetylase